MSDLKSQLTADMKSAMKSGEKDRLGVIRLMLAAIKQREVDERIELTDADVLVVLDRMVKQRRESISQFESAARDDLAAIERAELEVIQAYLPQQLSPEEIDVIVAKAVSECPVTGPAAMGQIMAVLKPQLQGRADMSQVSGLVKSRITA
jgi:uncharacterized protein YqeY